MQLLLLLRVSNARLQHGYIDEGLGGFGAASCGVVAVAVVAATAGLDEVSDDISGLALALRRHHSLALALRRHHSLALADCLLGGGGGLLGGGLLGSGGGREGAMTLSDRMGSSSLMIPSLSPASLNRPSRLASESLLLAPRAVARLGAVGRLVAVGRLGAVACLGAVARLGAVGRLGAVAGLEEAACWEGAESLSLSLLLTSTSLSSVSLRRPVRLAPESLLVASRSSSTAASSTASTEGFS